MLKLTCKQASRYHLLEARLTKIVNLSAEQIDSKCLKGLSPSYLSDKFSTSGTIHERQTRNRDSLNISPSRINAGQRAFYYRGVKVWNDLSNELREITNTKVFKRRLINELICDMN